MSSPSYQRALILHGQRRYADAERELRQALVEHPQDGRAHAMLALCLSEQKRLREATNEAQQAIGIEPDEPFAHYALAVVLVDRKRPGEALAPIQEAIRLDPYNPDHFALLSAIRLEQRAWPSALEAAERGLELDAEHEYCSNLRAMALVKLGRRSEAGATIGDSLSRNPENATTHANQGWKLLHDGDPKRAMHHFRESLRLDPTDEWAKAGIVEAIKARNPLYRWLLLYFLWMARLSSRAQWGIIIGGYIAYRVAFNTAQANPKAAPYLWPFVGAYIAFAAMTWVAYPLLNLTLRLHPLGKLALSDDQRRGANLSAITLALALGSLALLFATGAEEFITLTFVFAVLLMPTAGIFTCQPGWPRWTMAGVSIALLFLGVSVVAIEHLIGRSKATDTLFFTFAYAVLGSAFLANWMVKQRPKK